MQAVVRMPHINFTVNGIIPEALLDFLNNQYGENLELIEDEDEQYVNIEETEWFKDIGDKTSPGEVMKIYRENKGWTQKQLGEKLQGISARNISHYENGHRPISHKIAYQLSLLFNRPVEYFL